MILAASPENIKKAATLIREGSLVAFPTETVYGLGANALEGAAVSKIFKLKNRPATNPLIVHLSSIKEVESVAVVNERHRAHLHRIEHLWPGPLSVVLPKAQALSSVTTAGSQTVGIRIPAHEVARALIREAGVPIAAPSANRSTNVSPTTANHVVEEFGNESPLVLDGGPCVVGVESTILSLIDDAPRILRHGGITAEILAAALEVPLEELLRETSHIASPGRMREHYAPRTPLLVVGIDEIPPLPVRTGRIFLSPPPSGDDFSYNHAIVLSRSGDEEEIARGLFSALRDMDRRGLDLILIDPMRDEGLGRAIMDRIKRASARR